MTSSDTPRKPPSWEPDPLLAPSRKASPFMRVPWNASQAKPFGPWRIAPMLDPLSTVEMPDTLAMPAPTLQTDAPPSEPESAIVATPMPAPAVIGIPEDEVRRRVDEARARGLADGEARARKAAAGSLAPREALLRDTIESLRALSEDPLRFFEPLRRLALHIAEELVRGELRLSGEAVSRLVHHCLEQLDGPVTTPVVSLHPEDLAGLGALTQTSGIDCRFEPDSGLMRGSVRVTVADTVVEDLIEHRLELLARRLLHDPDAWRESSTLLNLTPQAGHPPVNA